MTILKVFNHSISLEWLILMGILYIIVFGHACKSCLMEEGYSNFASPQDMFGWLGKKVSEGYSGASTNGGQSSRYNLDKFNPVDTSKWFASDMVVVPGSKLSAGVQSMLDRPNQPVPLPKDELLMFANTEFKPECCPNTYSTSTGCACMTTKQYNYLTVRGGNNVPFSEY